MRWLGRCFSEWQGQLRTRTRMRVGREAEAWLQRGYSAICDCGHIYWAQLPQVLSVRERLS